ncbi:MAG: gas vesicle protein [Actinomycetota bacterium]
MADKDEGDEATGHQRGDEREGSDGGRGSEAGRRPGGGAGSRKSNGQLGGAELVRLARDQLVEMTGRPAFGVSGLAHTDDGWIIRVDLVELERIPPSTSVLASYEVELDEDGNLVGYERTRRFHLSQVDE